MSYAEFVSKVNSKTYATENVTTRATAIALATVIEAAENADVVKRSLFYGSQLSNPMRAKRLQMLETIGIETFGVMNIAPHLSEENKGFIHSILGVAGEAGELAQVVGDMLEGKPVDLVNVKEEVGDVLWYLQLLANQAGFTLDEAIETNKAKLMKRYPDAAFTAERAENRDLSGERDVLTNT